MDPKSAVGGPKQISRTGRDSIAYVWVSNVQYTQNNKISMQRGNIKNGWGEKEFLRI